MGGVKAVIARYEAISELCITVNAVAVMSFVEIASYLAMTL